MSEITEFQILNRKTKQGWDVKDIVTNVKWVTDLNFSAGELTFDLVEDIHQQQLLVPGMGNIVKFDWDNQHVFYGFVFKSEVKETNVVSVTAYDSMRYLKNEDSIVWQAGTIADRFNNVCTRAEIKHRVVNGMTYKVAAEVADGKSYFDMIKSAINATYTATGTMFYLTANYDTVELRKAPTINNLELVVDSRETLTGYTYSESIDNSANVVKVVQKNSSKSQTKTASANSASSGDDPKTTSFTFATAQGASVADWGKLQVTENKKDKANWAQMVQQAKDKLKEKNVVERSLTLDCIGNLGLTAGMAVDVYIADSKKTFTNCPITKATQNFGTDYTCSLEMKVGAKWPGNDSTSL